MCARGSGLRGPLAFGPARAREKGPPFLALETETWSLLLRAALLGSGSQESFWKESATLAEPTGFLHVSRAKVGARDATGTNGDPPRHPPLQAKLACSWHWQAGLRKVLGSALPGPAETWLPATAGVGQQHKIRGSALHAHMARPCRRPVAVRSRLARSGNHARFAIARAAASRRPCYGRRTDSARRSGQLGYRTGARHVAVAVRRPPGDGPWLQASNGIVPETVHSATERGQWGR